MFPKGKQALFHMASWNDSTVEFWLRVDTMASQHTVDCLAYKAMKISATLY